MTPQSLTKTRGISLIALLVSSFLFIANSSASNASSTGSEELAAASGSNRFIVWYDKTPGNYDIFFRRSADNGATWQATKNLSNNVGDSFFPEIAVSGPNVYVVWLQRDAGGNLEDVFLRRSTDNGATWKPIVKITSIGTVGTIPQVIASGGNVYVVWEQADGEIYLRRSADNGATWKPIFNLSSNPGESRDEKISVSGPNVYVVWYQLNSERTQSDIIFRRSTDNGATWKAKVNLSKIGQVSFPSLAVSGPSIHVVWIQDDPATDSGWDQVFIRSSADMGSTWNAAENLTSADVDIFNPVIATAGPNVYVLYEEDVSGGCCDAFSDLLFLASSDNGATWEPVETLATNVRRNGGDDPSLLALGPKVYLIWTDASLSSGQLFFRKSNDNGATWEPVSANLNNKNRDPRELQVAVSGSSIYLVWANTWPHEVYFLRSINSGTSWDSVDNISNTPRLSFGPSIGV